MHPFKDMFFKGINYIYNYIIIIDSYREFVFYPKFWYLHQKQH
ncbi:hypothetical protein THF1C08_50252 [Vibrio jasicida]|nr:hypothetical protein THF1C08_50252 [Vibrio jasicida]